MNNEMNVNMKKFMALGLAGALSLTAVGTFAYFSDREENNNGTPWTITLDDKGIDIRPVDPDNPDPTVPDDNPGGTIEEIWDGNNEGSVEDKDVYPGEEVDLGFDFVNGSDAAVDLRETIILTVKDYKGDPIALTDVLGTSEYEVWQSSAKDSFGAIDGVTDLTGRGTIDRGDANNNVIVYKLNPFTVDGVNEDADGTNGIDTRVSMAYKLVMDKLADNDWQASTCQVDYIVEAKQHAEGGADKGWAEVANETLTIGGNNYSSFVPVAK